MRFNKGQRVTLVNLDDGVGGEWLPSESNKVGNIGIVIAAEVDSVTVGFDNGSHNGYFPDNLQHLAEDNI